MRTPGGAAGGRAGAGRESELRGAGRDEMTQANQEPRTDLNMKRFRELLLAEQGRLAAEIHDLVGMDEQQGQQGLLLAPPERKDLTVPSGLERPQDAELDRPHVPPVFPPLALAAFSPAVHFVPLRKERLV